MNRLRKYILILITVISAVEGVAKEKHSRRSSDLLLVKSLYADKERQITDYYIKGLRTLILENDVNKAGAYFLMVQDMDSTHAPSQYELSKMIAKPKDAIAYAERAVRNDPSNIWYAYQLGELYSADRRFDSAISVYENILNQDRKNSIPYSSLAVLYNAKGDVDRAIIMVDSAANIFGRDIDVLEYKFELLMKAERYDDAISICEDLLAEDFQNSRYNAWISDAYIAKGDDKNGLQYINKGMEYDPSSTILLGRLSEYYRIRNESALFLSSLDKLFRLESIPADIKIEYLKGIMDNRGFYSENFPDVSRLVYTLRIKYPNNYDVSKIYAQHLIASGELDEALYIYKSHLGDSIPRIDVYNNIIGINSYKHRIDSALYYIDKARVDFPDNEELPMAQAAILSDTGRVEQAIHILRSNIKRLSSDSVKSRYYGLIGDLYQKSGYLSKCYSYYKKALKLDGDNITVLNNYSYFLSVENRDLERALAMSAKVLESEPSNPTYIDTYAWILYKLGRYQEALDYQRKAVFMESKPSYELLLHYGDILFALGQQSNALIYWEKAQEVGASESDIAERKKQLQSVHK